MHVPCSCSASSSISSASLNPRHHDVRPRGYLKGRRFRLSKALGSCSGVWTCSGKAVSPQLPVSIGGTARLRWNGGAGRRRVRGARVEVVGAGEEWTDRRRRERRLPGGRPAGRLNYLGPPVFSDWTPRISSSPQRAHGHPQRERARAVGSRPESADDWTGVWLPKTRGSSGKCARTRARRPPLVGSSLRRKKRGVLPICVCWSHGGIWPAAEAHKARFVHQPHHRDNIDRRPAGMSDRKR